MATTYHNNTDDYVICSSCSAPLENIGITEIQPRLGNFNLFQFLDRKGKKELIFIK